MCQSRFIPGDLVSVGGQPCRVEEVFVTEWFILPTKKVR
jgi:hypothetical protein